MARIESGSSGHFNFDLTGFYCCSLAPSNRSNGHLFLGEINVQLCGALNKHRMLMLLINKVFVFFFGDSKGNINNNNKSNNSGAFGRYFKLHPTIQMGDFSALLRLYIFSEVASSGNQSES